MPGGRRPAGDIAEGRRRPVILSSAARGEVIRLGKRASGQLVAGLERLAAAEPGAEALLARSFGEQGYKAFVAGHLLAVYREMTSDELMEQGFEERLARRGGIFVVDIIPTSESAGFSGEGRLDAGG